MLPIIPFPSRTAKQAQTAFGGLDRRADAANGALAGMTNLWSGDLPLLASRPPRLAGTTLTNPHGIFRCGNDVFTAAGTTLYKNGTSVGTVTNTNKVWAALGDRVIIFPDKKIYENGSLNSLESTAQTSVTFTDGTYAGEPAAANTIKAGNSFNWSSYFKVGDAVRIRGAADSENNYEAIIIREIDGDELRFYENSFTVNSTAATVTIRRMVPNLDFLCVNENRVWGCKGDEIRACKLGDPYNWNVFDGVATDSYGASTGTAGDFTAAITFMGYPIFFKKTHIFKVYGNKPTNYEFISAPTLGVLDGRSLAVARETLYYLSPSGFCAYNGGIPSPLGEELNRQYTAAVGGTDGLKYYVSAYDGTAWELLVYDPARGVWHREDALHAHSMAWALCLGSNGTIVTLGESGGTETVASEAVFADWDYKTFDGKYPVRMWVRVESTGTLTVSIRYDGGAWETAARVTAGRKSVHYLPLPIRRCDHYAIKITATDAWKLYALEHEYYTESTNRRA